MGKMDLLWAIRVSLMSETTIDKMDKSGLLIADRWGLIMEQVARTADGDGPYFHQSVCKGNNFLYLLGVTEHLKACINAM